MIGKRQQEILQLMLDGWELGQSLNLHSSFWLQKGGLGKGGEAKHNISPDVCFTLYKKGYIRTKYRKFPREAFELTELGKHELRRKNHDDWDRGI